MHPERCQLGEGHNVSLGMPKTFPAKSTKIVSTGHSSILMMPSAVYLLLGSVQFPFTK